MPISVTGRMEKGQVRKSGVSRVPLGKKKKFICVYMWPSNSTPDVYPQKQMPVCTEDCPQMFVSALFMMAKMETAQTRTNRRAAEHTGPSLRGPSGEKGTADASGDVAGTRASCRAGEPDARAHAA